MATKDLSDEELMQIAGLKTNPPKPQGLLDRITQTIGQAQDTANTGLPPMTPESYNNPLINSARKESMGMNSQMGNGAMFGIPGAIANLFGGKLPESSNPVANAGASLAGGMVGGPGMASEALAGPVNNAFVRGAVRGGTFGASMPGGIGQRALQGVGGAILGGPIEGTTNILSGMGKVAQTGKFTNQVNEAIQGGMSDVSGRYGSKLTEVSQDELPGLGSRVSFDDLLSKGKTLADQKVIDSTRKSLEFEGIDPKMMSADEAKHAMDIFKSSGKLTFGEDTPALKTSTYDVAGQMADRFYKAFPDMKGVATEYGTKANAADELPSTNRLLGGRMNRPTRVGALNNLETVAGRDTRRGVESYRAADTALKGARHLAPYAIGAGMFGMALHELKHLASGLTGMGGEEK